MSAECSCRRIIASKINGTPKGIKLSEKLQFLHHSVMKFDCSNKFDFCYHGQVNSLQLKSSAASKWASKHLWNIIYFAVCRWYILPLGQLSELNNNYYNNRCRVVGSLL